MTIDPGSTAFMLFAASLVLIMTPGLAFFYGGLVGRKNVLTIMMQSFVSMGVTTILWVTIGYSLSFGEDILGIIGNPMDHIFLRGISPDDTYLDADPGLPLFVFVAYQLMFAIITPALITGAFANRVNFKAYLLFLIAWLLFVYFPFVHMVWGGGFLADQDVLDFAGGIVVHEIAGMAALASVFVVGARRSEDPEPHNIPFIALGTALLWFGWFGFNAGSALEVSFIAGLAFINTHIAAAFAAITWMILEWIREGKPTLVGFCVGAVAGLATITPAAGFVSPQSAMLIGTLAGVVCYGAIIFRKRMNWDDALDVWGVHGIGGILGTLMLGVLASKDMNAGGADGLLKGGGEFFVKQLGAVIFAAVWSFVATILILKAIEVFTPVRVTDKVEQTGLDKALHGELAYIINTGSGDPSTKVQK